jgi:hypothetical protein
MKIEISSGKMRGEVAAFFGGKRFLSKLALPVAP